MFSVGMLTEWAPAGSDDALVRRVRSLCAPFDESERQHTRAAIRRVLEDAFEVVGFRTPARSTDRMELFDKALSA